MKIQKSSMPYALIQVVARRIGSARAKWLAVSVVLMTMLISAAWTQAADQPLRVGVAQVDITPDYPVRLSGFGFRRAESEGVTHKIWAKALAFADEERGPAILITTDNLCVSDEITQQIAERLAPKVGLQRERLTITATHTHTAPMLKNVAPTLFGMPIPPEHQANIDRYTREFVDKLEQVALAAVKDIQPSRLSWGIGSVGFAANRRTKGGPVDHDMPILVVRDAKGDIRAIYFSYACHCVTLSHNKIGGDWAGFAQEAVQRLFPKAVALASVGCGADSNPDPRGNGDDVALCTRQGQMIADEVKRLLDTDLKPITAKPVTRYDRIDLPLDTPRTRAEWEERARRADAIGHHARVNIARLDQGETLPTKINYPLQTWLFGDQLAIVFMPGETVVDYSLRLKHEFDRSRLWVNGYSNDGRCYIPSERIWKEGGYEGGDAMIYYDFPQRFAPGLEQKIIDMISGQLPKSFAAPKGTEGTRPLSPEEALRTIRTKPGLKIELVAAEPLVTSPVAIDWGADGRLWVCEMFDYPMGSDNNWQPGGRVRVLRDKDQDGRYDESLVFLDKLPFPTGVMAWGRGVFICAAPDILYAEDTDGDGKADKIEKWFSGFATDNYQARVNSLSLGLDNWIYGANGLLGGVITGGTTRVDIRSHDFRFRPGRDALETVSGLTQQGRVRDDWGRWFGCDNSRSLLVYPYEDRYMRRNPQAPSLESIISPRADFDVSRIFPASRTLERFNDLDQANRVTSACGLGLYRDTLLGEEYFGNTFTCEPVHNLVHRLAVTGDGAQTRRHRPEGEQQSEFLAATDNWFRPVQARTGPDGALYVVDMYRFLIEHPRWIPAERLAQIDVRAGSERGRIYRLRPDQGHLRVVRDLTRLDGRQLAAALDSPNGTERDRVQVELLVRRDASAASELERMAAGAALPQVRLQALSALEGLAALQPSLVEAALNDPDARVRQHAVRLCESFLKNSDEAGKYSMLTDSLLRLTRDRSKPVALQLAFTLGEWNDAQAGAALAELAVTWLNDPEIRVAVLSSARVHCGQVLAAVMRVGPTHAGRDQWISPLVATAAASGNEALFAQAIAAVLPDGDADPEPGQLTTLASLFGALDQKQTTLAAYIASHPELHKFEPSVSKAVAFARKLAADEAAPDAARRAALELFGRTGSSSADIETLCSLAASKTITDGLRAEALAALRRQRSSDVATGLLTHWKEVTPRVRAEFLALMMNREEWNQALLAAVKGGVIQTSEVPLPERQRLAQHANPEIRHLTAELFPTHAASDRTEIIQKYESAAALTGSAVRGQEVFSKQCAACHALQGIGHDVGPNLALLRGKDFAYWLKNILDPNAIVEPRFVSYQIVTKDGQSLTGIIRAETASGITLAMGGGVIENIPRSDVREIKALAASLMPDGLDQGISLQDMADLIACLKSGAPPRKFPGNAPSVVESGRDGSLLLPAAKAEIYGGSIEFEQEFKNIGMWHGADDHVIWTLRLMKSGTYDVYLDYACADASAGNEFVINVGNQTLTGKVVGTGSDWSVYKQIKIGPVPLETGEQRLLVRPADELRGALIDLRTVALARPGTRPRWPVPAAKPPSDNLLRDPVSIARLILDASRTSAAREAVIRANPQYAADLIVELTKDLVPGTPAEYEHIPWIWRVAMACGRRNDPGQMKRVLEVSLPKRGEPLLDWQAVAIGGGIINGMSRQGQWPADRVAGMLAGETDLWARWVRSLDLASEMADNDTTPAGTRYDALRMLGMETWEKRGVQLLRYLAAGTHEELQMGAVSGIADIKSPQATTALIESLSQLAPANRRLAVDALLRSEDRTSAFLQAIAQGKVDGKVLEATPKAKLLEHESAGIRQMARDVLK